MKTLQIFAFGIFPAIRAAAKPHVVKETGILISSINRLLRVSLVRVGGRSFNRVLIGHHISDLRID